MKILTLRELQPPLNGCVVYKHYHSYLSSEWVCGFAIALNREGNLSNSISWTARDRTELERERERSEEKRHGGRKRGGEAHSPGQVQRRNHRGRNWETYKELCRSPQPYRAHEVFRVVFNINQLWSFYIFYFSVVQHLVQNNMIRCFTTLTVPSWCTVYEFINLLSFTND